MLYQGIERANTVYALICNTGFVSSGIMEMHMILKLLTTINIKGGGIIL